MKQLPLSRLAWLVIAAVAASAATPAGADPFRRLPGLNGASLLRQTGGGWLDAEVDADLDPIYGRPASTATMTALGSAGDVPSLTAVLGLPWGEGRWSLAVEGQRRSQGGTVGTLTADESDLDGDGRPDMLRWRISEAADPSAAADRRLALRTGVRSETWALGLALVSAAREDQPASTLFAFPATRYVLPAAADSDDLYDLETGERLAGRRATLQAVDRREQLVVGLDFGLLRPAWRAALALAWQRDLLAERAESSVSDVAAGGERVRKALRDLATTDDWLRVDLRVDRAPPARGWRWSVGPGVRMLLGRDRSGSEALADHTTGLGGAVVEEWVRQRIAAEAEGLALEVGSGIGWVERAPRGDFAIGVDGRLDWQQRRDGWEDRLVWRIDDPGVPGQSGASFLNAVGGGVWSEDERRFAAELALDGAARVAVAERLELLLGTRLGWEIEQLRRSRKLDRTEPLRGRRLTDPGVVDPIELAYGNFSAPARQDIDHDAVIADLRLGLALADRRFRLGSALFWRGFDVERVALEAGVSW